MQKSHMFWKLYLVWFLGSDTRDWRMFEYESLSYICVNFGLFVSFSSILGQLLAIFYFGWRVSDFRYWSIYDYFWTILVNFKCPMSNNSGPHIHTIWISKVHLIIESSVKLTIELNWSRELGSCLQSEIVEDKLNGNMSLLLEKSWRKSCTVFGNFCRKLTILTFYGVLWWGWSSSIDFITCLMEIHRV